MGIAAQPHPGIAAHSSVLCFPKPQCSVSETWFDTTFPETVWHNCATCLPGRRGARFHGGRLNGDHFPKAVLSLFPHSLTSPFLPFCVQLLWGGGGAFYTQVSQCERGGGEIGWEGMGDKCNCQFSHTEACEANVGASVKAPNLLLLPSPGAGTDLKHCA